MNIMKKTALGSTIAFGALMAANPAFAQSAQDLQQQVDALQNQVNQMKAALDQTVENTNGDPVKVKWEPAPSFKSPDGLFEMNVRGRLFVDFAQATDKNNTMDVSASEIRQARLGVGGVAWKDVKYQVEVEFGGTGGAKLTDAYIQWSKPVSLKIGHFKPAVSLEENTSETNMSTQERASFTDAFGFSRNVGIQASYGSNGFGLAVGAFRGKQSSTEDNEGSILATRAYYGAKEDALAYHFGASVRVRNGGDRTFSYKQFAISHLTENFLSTGTIAQDDVFWGVEGAVVYDVFSLQGEYGQLKADMIDPTVSDDPTFTGGYISASWFVTGEQRSYDASKGSFGSVTPKASVFEGGAGAWQLVGRYDFIDLSDKDIFGGKQQSYIFGVNWLLNKHTRMQLNYSHSKIRDALNVSANGADGANSVNAFALRAHVSF